MAHMINVRDLSDEDVQLIQRLVQRLRAQTRGRRSAKKDTQREEEKIEFATWPLGVKGSLTREEIYDYL